MNDLIRKAVELADGYKWLHRDQVEIPDLNNAVLRPFEQQWFLDALAAQLTRQVDSLEWDTIVWRKATGIYDRLLEAQTYQQGDDRTMNTIKAIVDSGVQTP
jgi:hypothetical protein